MNMDLKIALSGDLPARCSDALAALAPELGMVPAAEGVPVRGHRGAALAVCCDGASVTLEWAQPDRKSTRLNSSHKVQSRMPSSA